MKPIVCLFYGISGFVTSIVDADHPENTKNTSRIVLDAISDGIENALSCVVRYETSEQHQRTLDWDTLNELRQRVDKLEKRNNHK